MNINTDKVPLEESLRIISDLLVKNKVILNRFDIEPKSIIESVPQSEVSITLDYEELNLLQLIKDGKIKI